MVSRQHWETVYRTKAVDAVSWYRPHLDTSLALIERAVPDRDACIIDIGAGEATLVDDLLERGYRQLSVLDISPAAIAVAQKRLGAAAAQVTCWPTTSCRRRCRRNASTSGTIARCSISSPAPGSGRATSSSSPMR